MAVTPEELKRQIVGPIAAVPTAFDHNYRVDHGRMRAAAERWIESGLVNGRSVLKVGAAIGEGHFLREEEWLQLLVTVAGVARDRVPVVGATHHRDTMSTVEDVKRATDAGAEAVQVSPPIFNLPTPDDMLRYYGAVSEAVDIGIIIYITHWLPHGGILPQTLARMVDFERIVATKWSPPPGSEYEEVFELADRFNILDNTNSPIRCHQLGGHGYMVDGIECYPPYYLGLWDLMREGQYDRAQEAWDRFIKPFSAFFQKVVTASGSDAKVAKGMSQVMGVDLGPPRPPSVPMNAGELAELRALMVGWGWPVPGPAVPTRATAR